MGSILESKQLKDVMLEALVNTRDNAESMSAELLSDQQKIDALTKLVGELLHVRLNSE